MNRKTVTITGREINRALVFKTLSLLLISWAVFLPEAGAQTAIDDELRNIFSKEPVKKQDITAPLRESHNEIKATFSLAFAAYKTLLSSQDQPSCVFAPSCSEYAIEALTRKGAVTGWLYTFDRLSRCHGFVNPRHYTFSKIHNRFYDPVK